jgi:hypothetical protein
MAWDGYFTYDGREIINVARTEAYALNLGAYWFRNQIKPFGLREMLGDAAYTTPDVDAAPWYDPDRPESAEFFGFYPLSVDGIDSSSREASIVESTREGGVPGRVRHATKAVVFNGLLMALNEKAAEFGSQWLRRTLLGAPCAPYTHDYGIGSDLTYLSSKPDVPNPAQADLAVLRRTLQRVSITTGPTVTGKKALETCDGEMWMVQFTAIAGNPFQFGDERPILAGWLDGGVANPWAATATAGTISATSTFAEVDCGVDLWDPIYDPLCAAVVEPPAPPSLPLGCFDPPASWTRRIVVIPAENVPVWDMMVPVLTVHAPTEQRNVRIRIYDDPTESLDPTASPCLWSADLVIGYIPAGGTLTIDGSREEVWVETVAGQVRRADTLVFATDGTPFRWPVMTCGAQQQVTLDVEDSVNLPIISLSLVPQVV